MNPCSTLSASIGNRRLLRTDDPVTLAAEPELDISDDDFEPSLDLFYKITPQLNGSLTINTDFSATEVDDRQVNLTRFGLFFASTVARSGEFCASE